MPSRRRFEATNETVLRDLAATLVRMGAPSAEIALGARPSKELTRQDQRDVIAAKDLQMALAPADAAIGFERAGRRYRVACAKDDDRRDSLRAARRGVTLTWTVYGEYGVNEGRAAQEPFERLFGGHRLQLGDGTTGAVWHEVLKVSPSADLVVVRASDHALSTVLHPDNRATGDAAAMLRLNRAYAEAWQALGVA